MSVQVSLLNEFQRRLKRLARKFRTLDDEIDQLVDRAIAPNQALFSASIIKPAPPGSQARQAM